MKKRRGSRLRRSAMALTMTGAMLLGILPAAASGSQTQISSPEETVYVNTYAGDAREILFNDHWRFHLGDVSNAQDQTFNDATWEHVNLPHDYSIEQAYTSAGEAESGYLPGGIGWYRKSFQIDPAWKTEKRLSVRFDGVYMNAEVYLNGQKLGSHPYGYTTFSFELPADRLQDGENVLAVKVNNPVPSSRWYSGSGIYRDVHLVVTDPVHVAPNGVTITTPDYETGSGRIHVQTVLANDGKADVNDLTVVTSVLEKGSDAVLVSAETPVSAVTVSGTASAETDVTVSAPKQWNVWSEGPASLYTVRTELKQGDKVLDTVEHDFGFRHFKVDLNTGFSINGKNVKLQGVCMHHDQGALGSEARADAIRRQVKILKEMGCNAIRVTHNPAARVLMEVCNEEGMLIIEEAFDTWSNPKNGNSNDFSAWFNRTIGDNPIEGGRADRTWAEFDLKSMVGRDKNDPCCIMWSLGNEIFEGLSWADTSRYPQYAENMIRWVGEIDKTRYVTIGDNRRATGTGEPGQVNARIADAANIGGVKGGVVGFNYGGGGEIPQGHGKGWLMYGSETASAVNSRGVYDVKGSRQRNGDESLTSYDKSCVGWGATASDAWLRTVRNDFDAGEFVWTGFDYLGEPTPCNGTGPGKSPDYRGPFETAPKSSYFGIIDTTGFPKDSFYFYQSQWHKGYTTLHVLPAWNREEILLDSSNRAEVVVYSDAPVIRLYLNDVEVGAAKAVEQNTTGVHPYQFYEACALQNGGVNAFRAVSGHESLYAAFDVPYEAGTLEARAYADEAAAEPLTGTVGRSKVETVGAAHHLKLTVDPDKTTVTADGRSLSYITIDVVDEQGRVVNSAMTPITVEVSGAGTLVGMDNGMQADHTSYQSKTWKAGHGKLLAIVQAGDQAGTIQVTATADGLLGASASVRVQKAPGSAEGSAHPESMTYARNYFLKLGSPLELPAAVQVNFTDGHTEQASVTWDKSGLDTSAEGTAVIPGTVTLKDGLRLTASVNVTVLSEVACLKNDSAAVMKGTVSAGLPGALPAVLPDGTVSRVSFPVEWNLTGLRLDVPGTYVVPGTANVFGKTMTPTATVRVSEGTVIPSGNVAGAASRLYLDGAADPALEVLRDGRTGATSPAWTGAGNIQFYYDTAQNMIQVVLYTQGVTEAPVISKGAAGTWTPIEAQVSSTRQGDVTVWTYDFGLLSSENLQIACKPGTTLTEAEIHVGTPTFPVGSTAALQSLTVNGTAVPAAILKNGFYHLAGELEGETPIAAEGRDNAAVTILPRQGNRVKLLLEAEDNSETGEFVIYVNSNLPNLPPADDPSMDYPRENTTADAPSQQSPIGNEGGAALALDGRENTLWHSRWGGGTGPSNLKNSPELRYIQLNLQAPAELVGLRYLPRPDAGNGNVTEYRVETSLDGQTYTTAASGEWARDASWKQAAFDVPVTAQYVRLYGVTTYGEGDQGNQFMSAAEVRVMMKPVDPNDTTITGFVSMTLTVKLGEEIRLPATVTANCANGSTREAAVTWDALPQQPSGTFEVRGTVEGTALRPAVTVTVIDLNTDLAENKAQTGLPMAIAWVSSPGDNPSHATDGHIDWTLGDSKNIWSDWEKNTYHMDQNWMGVILSESPQTLGEIRVGFYEEGSGTDVQAGHKVRLPQACKVEYYTGPACTPGLNNGMVRDWIGNPLKDAANWTEVTYKGEKPAVPARMTKEMTSISFEPVDTTAIRISLTPQDQQWVGLAGFQVFAGEKAPERVCYRVDNYETLMNSAQANTGKGPNQWGDGVVDFAFDGKTDGTVWSQNYENSDPYDPATKAGGPTAAPTEQNPVWFSTDLGAARTLGKLVLVNKLDTNGEQWVNTIQTGRVYVADTPEALDNPESLAAEFSFPAGYRAQNEIILQPGVQGRYVKVVVTGSRQNNRNITLAECELWALEEAPVEPAITDPRHSLSLDDIVTINEYVQITGYDPAYAEANGGLLIWKTEPADPSFETAEIVREGLIHTDEGYGQKTGGIAAKEYGDLLYLRTYVKNEDGTCTYGPLTSYSVRTYCDNAFKTDNELLKNACRQLLHFGAAAQTYFDYSPDALANDGVPAGAAWDESLLNVAVRYPEAIPVPTGDISLEGRSLSLDGKIMANFYFKPQGFLVEHAELLYWRRAPAPLVEEDAVTVAMTPVGTSYGAQACGFAADEYEDRIFVCAKMTDPEGKVHYSGLLAFSPEIYADLAIRESRNPALVEAVRQMVLYGEAAKAYLP